MSEEPMLGAHVKPRLTDARLARQWDVIASRVGRPRRGSRFVALSLAGATALCLVLFFGFYRVTNVPGAETAWTGVVVRSSEGSSRVDLKDGSTIELAPESRLTFTKDAVDETRVALETGSATFSIAKRGPRPFFVTAGGVIVKVVGTRFTVGYEGGAQEKRVHVDVDEGVVQVVAEGRTVALSHGQRWSTALPAPSEKEAVAHEPEAKNERPSEAVRDRGADRLAKKATPESEPPTPPETARSLFEEANAARRSGDVAEAVRAYQGILDRFPGDQRTGLAAFELARLQMDRYGDAASAVRSLNHALGSSSTSSFREDAMARLASAYDAMGERTRCREAQKAYLENYPNGVHRASVSARCGKSR